MDNYKKDVYMNDVCPSFHVTNGVFIVCLGVCARKQERCFWGKTDLTNICNKWILKIALIALWRQCKNKIFNRKLLSVLVICVSPFWASSDPPSLCPVCPQFLLVHRSRISQLNTSRLHYVSSEWTPDTTCWVFLSPLLLFLLFFFNAHKCPNSENFF